MVNELILLRKLKSPGVITLFDICESEQYVHLVFEVINNASIFEIIKRRRKYSEADAREIMKSLLEIMDLMHSKNIIYRDVHPKNMVST